MVDSSPTLSSFIYAQSSTSTFDVVSPLAPDSVLEHPSMASAASLPSIGTSTATSSNGHSLVTRSKSSIFKLRVHSHLYYVLDSPILHSLLALTEPKCYKTASRDTCWITTMEDELRTLTFTSTWELVPRPSQLNVVGSKWVIKIKYFSNSFVDRFKARLVAKGYT